MYLDEVRRPVLVLARAFAARFFENEITAGTNDLKASFFWLVAFLAPIGILMPWFMVIQYQVDVVQGGPELLRRLSMAEKVLYLGFGMVTAGAICAVTWSALSMDRRDALVLGPLPLAGRTIVSGKLLGLATYVGLVSVGMHLGASVSFAIVLSVGESLLFAVRGMVAHFIAAGLGSAFVLFSIAALQGLVVATVGPRFFARVSPGLQIIVSASVFASFVTLPLISQSVVTAVSAQEHVHTWVLSTPPVWFLGLYESILGTNDPVLHSLAGRALGGTALAMCLTLVSYPAAYRRIMLVASEASEPLASRGLGKSTLMWLERAVARAPETRAGVQFAIATWTRVERHRMVLALSAGFLAALLLPAILRLGQDIRAVGPTLTATVLSAPVAAILFSLVGVRVAASLPGDSAGSWIFDFSATDNRGGRVALWRLMFLFGVLPWVGLCTGLLWLLWGPSLGLTHGLVCLAIGILDIELLLWDYAAMPSARPWQPDFANARIWWPAYAIGALAIARGVPSLTMALDGSYLGLAIIMSLVMGLALALNLGASRAKYIRESD